MHAPSVTTNLAAGQTVAPGVTGVRRDLAAIVREYVLRLLVIALGIYLGSVVAFVVSLLVGWIDLGC